MRSCGADPRIVSPIANHLSIVKGKITLVGMCIGYRMAERILKGVQTQSLIFCMNKPNIKYIVTYLYLLFSYSHAHPFYRAS